MAGGGEIEPVVPVEEALLQPALRAGPNRRFRDPWFALQVAGFRRAPVQIKGIGKGHLIPVVRQGVAKKSLWFRSKKPSYKFSQNCEFRLFQRPDEVP